MNTKYTTGLVFFFREIFLSAYFQLFSLTSGHFGKKNWFRKTRNRCEGRYSTSSILLVTFFGTPLSSLLGNIFLHNFVIHSFKYKIYSRHCHLFLGNIFLLVNHTSAKYIILPCSETKKKKTEFALA